MEGRWVESPVKLPNEFITSIFETSTRRILVSTDAQKGMLWFDKNKVFSLRVADGDIFGVAEDNQGDLWVASHAQGLLHLRKDGNLIESFDKKLLGKLNVAIAFDPKREGLWLTSTFGEFGFFKDGKVAERYGAKDGLGEGIIRDPHTSKKSPQMNGRSFFGSQGNLELKRAMRSLSRTPRWAQRQFQNSRLAPIFRARSRMLSRRCCR
jgi:hypothetical protein